MQLKGRKTEHQAVTKTIWQLGFRCGQQSSQPATTASGFDRKATRNPQLHIVPSVVFHAESDMPTHIWHIYKLKTTSRMLQLIKEPNFCQRTQD